MNTARAAIIVAVCGILFGLAGFALAGYCELQNRAMADQLAATDDALQGLSADNQDLSDRLNQLQPAGPGAPAAGRGTAKAKMDPTLAGEIRGIETRLNDLDGGQTGAGIKSDISRLTMDVADLQLKVDDLARRH